MTRPNPATFDRSTLADVLLDSSQRTIEPRAGDDRQLGRVEGHK